MAACLSLSFSLSLSRFLPTRAPANGCKQEMVFPNLSKRCAAVDLVGTDTWHWISDDEKRIMVRYLRDDPRLRGLDVFRLVSKECEQLSADEWQEQREELQMLSLLFVPRHLTTHFTAEQSWVSPPMWKLNETPAYTLDLSRSKDLSIDQWDALANVVLRVSVLEAEEYCSRDFSRWGCAKTVAIRAKDADEIGEDVNEVRVYQYKDDFPSRGLFQLEREMGRQAANGGGVSKGRIRNLQLESCNLRGRKLGVLSKALGKGSALEVLCLTDNLFGDDGAQCLSYTLKDNAVLTSLDISRVSLGNQGAMHIAEALKVNTGLRTLDMQWNSIRDEGVQAIADALESNSTLETLRLSYNPVREVGVASLTAALGKNNTLKHIDCSSSHAHFHYSRPEGSAN